MKNTQKIEKKEKDGRNHTVEEWSLQKEKMNYDKMYVIAKARWILHGERCKMMKRERRRVDVDIVIEKLKEELKWTREHEETEKEETKKQKEKKEKGKKERKKEKDDRSNKRNESNSQHSQRQAEASGRQAGGQ